MHILLIHQAFSALDEPGGTRHHELARYLSMAGHQVSIIASPVSYLTGRKEKNQPFESDANGLIRIYRVYTYPALHKNFVHRSIGFLSFMISSFFMSLKIRNVDIVWGTSPPIFQSFTAWLVSFLKNRPFLLEIRDLWPAFAVDIGVLKNRTLIRLSLWLEKFLYKNAGQIIVNSPGYIEHIENKGGKDITLIPNGSDISLFPKYGVEVVRNQLGWDHSFIVLYAGAHGLSNDLNVILDTADLLKNTDNLQFVLLGDGKEKPAIINLARQRELNNLSFMDAVPKAEMARIFAGADACIAILKPIEIYKTTYPNKVFDYMAAGKPIILAIDGVIREVVESANCGVFCQPGNSSEIAAAVLFLMNHPLKSQSMGNNGRKYLKKNFNREKIANQLMNVLINLAGKDVRKNSDR